MGSVCLIPPRGVRIIQICLRLEKAHVGDGNVARLELNVSGICIEAVGERDHSDSGLSKLPTVSGCQERAWSTYNVHK
jgi:hypothetical protein